jgi:hypothetical protein
VLVLDELRQACTVAGLRHRAQRSYERLRVVIYL